MPQQDDGHASETGTAPVDDEAGDVAVGDVMAGLDDSAVGAPEEGDDATTNMDVDGLEMMTAPLPPAMELQVLSVRTAVNDVHGSIGRCFGECTGVQVGVYSVRATWVRHSLLYGIGFKSSASLFAVPVQI